MFTYLIVLFLLSFFYLVYYLNVYKTKVKVGFIKEKTNNYFTVVVAVFLFSFSLIIVQKFFFQFGVIPSESMMPAFKVGQKILINKSGFGIRAPLTNESITTHRLPLRGEPIVTQFPLNPQIFYIKRVIGLPKDVISLSEKGLTINDDFYPLKKLSDGVMNVLGKIRTFHFYKVTLPNFSWIYALDVKKSFPVINKTFVKEKGFYFIGDNLSYSSDSREYGVIPESYFIGSVK